jgi:hypothetical protein
MRLAVPAEVRDAAGKQHMQGGPLLRADTACSEPFALLNSVLESLGSAPW